MPHINPRRKRRICVGLDCTYTHCLTSSLTHGRTPAFPLICSSLATKQHLKNAPPHHHTALQRRADTVTALLQPEATQQHNDDQRRRPWPSPSPSRWLPRPDNINASKRTNERTNKRTNERTNFDDTSIDRGRRRQDDERSALCYTVVRLVGS